MKHSTRTVVIGTVGLLVAAAWLLSGGASMFLPSLRAEEKKGGLPPLKVDKKAPLLLEEPKRDQIEDFNERPVADNDSCYVCHENFRGEPLVHEHAKVNVGCVRCHGASLAHRDDEEHLTPPDVIFGPHNLEKGCVECHDEHDVPAKKIVARWKERCPNKAPDDLLCVDCHGQHRLEKRQVEWDKKTRKLIYRKVIPDAQVGKKPVKEKGSGEKK